MKYMKSNKQTEVFSIFYVFFQWSSGDLLWQIDEARPSEIYLSYHVDKL